MAYEFGTPNYDLPQTVPSDKRDWADTNIPFLKLDQDLHYTKELAEGFDSRISAVEDTVDNHEIRLTELEKFIEDSEDGSKHEYQPGNLFLKDGRVCVAILEIHEGHELVEGQNYEVYTGGNIKVARYSGNYANYAFSRLYEVFNQVYQNVRVQLDGSPIYCNAELALFYDGGVKTFSPIYVSFYTNASNRGLPVYLYGIAEDIPTGKHYIIHAKSGSTFIWCIEDGQLYPGPTLGPNGVNITLEIVYLS